MTQPERPEQPVEELLRYDEEDISLKGGMISFGGDDIASNPFAALASLRDKLEDRTKIFIYSEEFGAPNKTISLEEQNLGVIDTQRQMVVKAQAALEAATAPYDVPSRRASVSEMEARLRTVELPVVIDEAELQRQGQLKREELAAAEVSRMLSEHRALGAMVARACQQSTKGAAVDRLRGKETSLDRVLATKDEPVRIACLKVYADGLGAVNESASKLGNFLEKVLKTTDIAAQIMRNISDYADRADTFSSAAFLFIWGKTRLMSNEKSRRLEAFLLEPNNSSKLRKNIKSDTTGVRIVADEDPMGRQLVSLAGLIPLYSEWMAQELGTTTQS